jgi:ferric-dicitrate binding protein FerR (iron transport regulator)
LDVIVVLLQKRLKGETLSHEETVQLDLWKSRFPENTAFDALLDDQDGLRELLRKWHEIEQTRQPNKLRLLGMIPDLSKDTGRPVRSNDPAGSNDGERSVRRVAFLRRYWAAAVIILVLVGGAYSWIRFRQREQTAVARVDKPMDLAPGKNGAILTLADGKQVVLDSLGDGVIATQNGARAILKGGQLAYDLTGQPMTGTVYNTMTTPKGRQFRVLLPDGTNVWLNAASSIRYPTVFNGGQRKVAITGEAYFEVAKNSNMPFIVEVGQQAEIEVLGTQFNVNAYENENGTNTTLLEGAVKVSSLKTPVVGQHAKAVVLKPGQQAKLAGNILAVKDANIAKALAWKNGLFNFEGSRIEEVMRQLERWYDINVKYEGTIPDIKFKGEIYRNVNLSDLLEGFQEMGLQFQLQGRTLVVKQ